MKAFRRTLNVTIVVLAGLGLASVALVGTGVVLDYRAFDPTEGAYEPPYENYTGEPIDWSRLDVTDEGLVYRGFVVDILVNCQSGMISFEVYRIRVQWRKLSPRAIAIHEPRPACRRRGFDPRF